MENIGHRAYWRVNTKLEKFNSNADFEAGIANEVMLREGNMLLNEGINILWDLVAGTAGKTPFDATHAFIGVGNNGGTTAAPLPGDVGLNGPKRMYMKMDAGYPIAGANQKIVFKSTFLPGVACFEWLEWSVANGNGNIATGGTFSSDEVRLLAQGLDPVPDPLPVAGVAFDYGVGEAAVVNLNHKQENMGQKYSPATWVITVEISLS